MKTNIPSDSEIRIVLTQILTESLSWIRIQGALGNHKSCEIEADHVHNLPSLLLNYSDELLAFYYNTERTIYMAQCGGKYPQSYEAHWNTLAMKVNAIRQSKHL